ncbi:MAG: hypothetical protein KME07_20825 [Pegethrix bostrychoides GSE-TBD4-15B]|jgi:Ca2+-binding RTX toxin-like protein|uniref:Peptidase C-terminal archaeal/bacterial domain-containing protein n=1 Tax=Pegethrix bostrychoides GSE-TBD4-15B TaxID=2839662 RepID=A0A951U6I3_9CYAN|nr:hypothetical protein [Pegethrix bostrychoides GSE-TBD4-15B]
MSDFGLGFYNFYDSDRSSDSNGSFRDAQYVGKLRSDLDISGSVGGYSYFGLGLGYYSDSNDYFLFELTDDRNVVIKSDENDVAVRLYDEDRRYIGRLDEDDYGGNSARDDGYEDGLAVSLERGYYYLRVSGGYDYSRYEIDFDAAADDDGSLDDAQRLGTLDCSKRISGRVGELDFSDSYRFRPGRSGAFSIRQTDNFSGRRPELRLYDQDQDLIATGSAQIRRSLKSDRDYYLRVAARDSRSNQDYRITLTPNPLYKGTNRDDRLRGCADDEILRGLAGDDQLIGNKGNDQLVGGAGDDRLIGDAGDDRLTGGGGFDVLSGGQGRDVFVLGGNNGDRIRDFKNGLDRLELPSQLSFSDLTLTQQGRNMAILAGNSRLAILAGTQLSQIEASDFV